MSRGRRRVKGQTIDLNSFLGGQNVAPGFVVVTPKRDWADYVEEETEEKYSSYRKDEKIVLPTAPKAARGPDFDVSKIPSEPPFTAYVGNLPFDVTEDEIMRFFGNLNAISVRLPREGGERGRMKGFGYAEFENKQSLIEALSLNGECLKNRPIRVSLAGESEGGKGDRRNDGIDRTASDWRAAPRSDDSFSRNQRNTGGSYNRYDDSEREPYRGRGSYGEDRSRYQSNDQGFQRRRSAERDRDYGSSERRYGRQYRDSGFDSHDRDQGSDWRSRKDDYDSHNTGYDRSNRDRRDERDRDSSFNRRNRNDRKDDYDSKRDDGHDRERPKERTRLQLKPRSVPVGDPAAPSVSSSIFGGAKPVDTAAKEREIEQRLAKQREKSDSVKKPSYIGHDYERVLDKKESKFSSDEPLKENRGRGLERDQSPKEQSRFSKVSEQSNTEQENGEPAEFLSNKFAHLMSEQE